MEERTRNEVLIAATTIAIWILIGTFVFHSLEDWNWIQSFYFSVVTLTTVGYGDLVPTSDTTRLFVSFYILIGVGGTVAALGIIANDLMQRRQKFSPILKK